VSPYCESVEENCAPNIEKNTAILNRFRSPVLSQFAPIGQQTPARHAETLLFGIFIKATE
jgi:hypothetical protein